MGRAEDRKLAKQSGNNPRKLKRRFYITAKTKPLPEHLRNKHILDQF